MILNQGSACPKSRICRIGINKATRTTRFFIPISQISGFYQWIQFLKFKKATPVKRLYFTVAVYVLFYRDPEKGRGKLIEYASGMI